MSQAAEQLPRTLARGGLPARAGVGLKAEHYRTVIETRSDVGFFEVHAENYMGAGGPPHRYLAAVRERYALSMHGVGLSIGGMAPLDALHLQRLKALNARYAPALFSEHLAWSTHGTRFFNDLLPLPYTAQTLVRVADHVDELQNALGRQVLIENPSTYVAYSASDWSEPAFFAELVRRTGCGLLLDVNNVYVACTNQVWDMVGYIDAFPLGSVREIHLAGHARECDEAGRPLLIDTHDRLIDDEVWALFARVIERTGPVPSLIEWDSKLPDWAILQEEAERAEATMYAMAASEAQHAARR